MGSHWSSHDDYEWEIEQQRHMLQNQQPSRAVVTPNTPLYKLREGEITVYESLPNGGAELIRKNMVFPIDALLHVLSHTQRPVAGSMEQLELYHVTVSANRQFYNFFMTKADIEAHFSPFDTNYRARNAVPHTVNLDFQDIFPDHSSMKVMKHAAAASQSQMMAQTLAIPQGQPQQVAGSPYGSQVYVNPQVPASVRTLS